MTPNVALRYVPPTFIAPAVGMLIHGIAFCGAMVAHQGSRTGTDTMTHPKLTPGVEAPCGPERSNPNTLVDQKRGSER